MDKDRIIKAIEELAEYDAVAGLFCTISHNTCETAIKALESLLDDNENKEKQNKETVKTMDKFMKMLIDNYVNMEVEVVGRMYPQVDVTFSKGAYCKTIVLTEEELFELNEIGAEAAFMIELEKFLIEIDNAVKPTTEDEKQIVRIADEKKRLFGR